MRPVHHHKPKITAVIPAYNGTTRYLGEAIESVLAQSRKDLELIVVDDASSDDTEGLVRRYPGVRFHRRPSNGGQAAARNDGARLASGEYLAFLDQDDLWDPSILATLVSILEAKAEAAAAHADGYQVDEQNRPLQYDTALKPANTITQMLRGGHDLATSGTVFRKACFDCVGGYDENLAVWEDIDLGIRLYQRYPIEYVPRPLYRHRLYGHNASRDIPSERALRGRKRFLEKHAGSCARGTAAEEALKIDWANYFSDVGKFYLRSGQTRLARKALLRAIRSYPWQRKSWLRLLGTYLGRPRSSGHGATPVDLVTLIVVSIAIEGRALVQHMI